MTRTKTSDRELTTTDLDAVSGGTPPAARAHKAQSDLSARWSQHLDGIAQNFK